MPTGQLVAGRLQRMRTFYADQHRLHDTDNVRLAGHPFVNDEVPVRAEILLGAVRAAGFGPVLPPADYGPGPILAVHDAEFVTFLQTVYAENAAHLKKAEPVFPSTISPRQAQYRPRGTVALTGFYAFGVDCPILEGTWSAAYWSAQCALAAAAQVQSGDRVAYALCRPPGHHAAADLYGGFCYLNNAAIAARFLSERVAILDIDYHHGNGTQLIFYDDPRVLFCSLHAHPDDDYPFFWGAEDELGAGAGQGFNYNWTLPQGTGDDRYLATLDKALAVVRGFAPRYLIVSVGFDTAAGDPLGGFKLTRSGLNAVGRGIRALGLPTVLVQEGGYLLARLADNATSFLAAFT